MADTTTAPATPKPKKKKARDPDRVPKPRERSPRMKAMVALELAEKKRPPLAAKVARLETAKANLAKLDGEIAELTADVVRLAPGAAATKTPEAQA